MVIARYNTEGVVLQWVVASLSPPEGRLSPQGLWLFAIEVTSSGGGKTALLVSHEHMSARDDTD